MMTIRKTSLQVRATCLAPVLLAMLFACPLFVSAQDSQWIWSPRQNSKTIQRTDCFFRKKFTLVRPEQSEWIIAAGDRYELYVNGKLASHGESYGNADKLDATTLLQPGVNLIAVRVQHIDNSQAGLAMKLRIKEKGETRWRSLVTDESWKTRIEGVEEWKSTGYDDMGWLNAQAVGVANLGRPMNAGPSADNHVETAQAQKMPPPEVEAPQAKGMEERFDISNEFTVQQVMLEEETGSLIAMAFNEFGKLILSREGGPLLIADPSKSLKDPNRIRVLCNQVNTCQGILPLNGDIYVTGDGPDGLAVYRLTDANRDGAMEVADAIVKFTGELGEHGPHGLMLGNDGMIYVVIGNGSQVDEETVETSPFQHTYEGDLVPRYEDPGGHAVGVKAPGGTIVRMTLDGSRIETVAGGLRNCYDLAFNVDGELFTHDSDMESDMGMSWYRPTKVFHIPDGAEFGWRSGWAKFPEYFIDQTPSVCDTGRGSPTGAVLYQHLQFPARYHDTIFLADWSEGRILSLRTRTNGAGYVGQTEEFMKGRPMNVSDLAVGEDGSLYFCTGGRGTAGGVYRIVWNGRVPQKLLTYKNELEKIVRHPQPGSAWARQNIAKLKESMPVAQWNEAMTGVATEKKNSVKYRLQALDKMVLFGPFPSASTLTELATDESTEIRSRAANLCGLKSHATHLEILNRLIADSNPRVRRIACQSYMRIGHDPALEALIPMLSSKDRIESMVARKALEKIPAVKWEKKILYSDDIRVSLQGALAIVTSQASLENSYNVLARCSAWMDGFVNDDDFIDLLRVVQLSLAQGKVDPAKIPAFTERIRNEFPSSNGTINRELARILAYLKTGSVEQRINDYLMSHSDSAGDKLHVALYLQTIGNALANDERFALIEYLEEAYLRSGGGSYKFYLSRAIRDISSTISMDQVLDVLNNADRLPNSVISAFYKMPRELDADYIELIKQVDQRAKNNQEPASNQIRLGVVAILAQSGNEEAMDYLRLLWQQEPNRRADISIGLAQDPANENWAYLVGSLPVLDDLTSSEVLEKLTTVNRRPRDPGHYREVIQLGYRLRAEGAKRAAGLLEHWTGVSSGPATDDWSELMSRWKVWFESSYPNEPVISIELEAKMGNYSTDEVLSYLETNGVGNAEHGKAMFSKAQCATCHRLGSNGLSAGPDLTSIARRFSKREIVESIVNPSQFVSDQYRSMTILTEDGATYSGLATENSDGSWLVMQSDGMRVRVDKESIEEIKESELSTMPAQLLDGLTLKEIADLMSYLENGDSYQSSIRESSKVH